MTCSESQILANRANALKSTGPRTDAGKLQSRRNALRHGLASTGVVLLPEDEAKLAERRQSWGEVLRPADEVEEFLVDRAIVHSVKVERASAVESASAVASVERADREYEVEVLGRLEVAEAEVRAWSRLGEEMAKYGTLGRDGLDSVFRLLKVGRSEDPRRYDLFDLAREAGSGDPAREASRVEARQALADLIEGRLEERRHAVARIFEELDGPEGRDLARAKAAIDPDPTGVLARRYEQADERGLLQMLKELDRRRKISANSPDSERKVCRFDGAGNLGKIPNEPNEVETSERSSNPGNLGKLPNEPNRVGPGEQLSDPGNRGKLPNEPNGGAGRGDSNPVRSAFNDRPPVPSNHRFEAGFVKARGVPVS